jgi:asparagine synthase (glutamine-hydrolysing)
MCGIGGIVFSSLTETELESKVAPFHEVQKHRGPDDQAHFLSLPCLLMHQRLTLIDAEGGAQPFQDLTKRYTLIWNGEVYNHDVLRELLKIEFSIPFQTRSDTEVLLYLLIHYGVEGLNRIEGMFAGALWDSQEEQLTLFRDALGIKPLVCAYENATLYFASEVKGLLTLLPVKPLLNEEAIMRHWLMPALSMTQELPFLGMQILEEGSALIVSRGKAQTISWLQTTRSGKEYSPNDLLKALKESLHLTTQSDFNVGIFLSGGLDSSLLYVLAKEAEISLESLSLDYEDLPSCSFDKEVVVNSDDRPFVQKIISTYGGKHQFVSNSFDEYREIIKTLSIVNDRIPSWEQEVSQQTLAAQATKTSKAILVGDAADELFYGYHFCLDKEANSSVLHFFNRMGAYERVGLLNDTSAKKFTVQSLANEFKAVLDQQAYIFDTEVARMEAITFLLQKYWLQRLMHHGDIHLMHHSLEGRLPFANRMVHSIASTLSSNEGFKKGIEKAFLREAARDVLPDEWRLRKKSALPRDPRQKLIYSTLLEEVLVEPHEFIVRYFNLTRLGSLLQKETWTEWEGQAVFHVITLHFWLEHYAAE